MIASLTKLTRREYDDISKLMRRQEKVAKTRAKQQAAELIATFEADLAREFEADDGRWRGVTADLAALTERANREITRICREAGVRPEFAPSYHLSWSSRGANMAKERRAELRAAAETRISAMLARANADIEERSVGFETELLGGTLETDRARELLEAMPKAALALMTPLDPAELDRTLPLADRYGWSTPELPGGRDEGDE